MKSKSKGLVIGAFMVLLSGATAYAVLNKKSTSKETNSGTIDLTTVTVNIQALKDQTFDFSNDAKTKGDGLKPFNKMKYTLLLSVNNPTKKELEISSCEIKLTIDGVILAFVPAEENIDGTPIVLLPKESTVQVPYKLCLALGDSLKIINWPANEFYKRYQRLDGKAVTGLSKLPSVSEDAKFNSKLSQLLNSRDAVIYANVPYNEQLLAGAFNVLVNSPQITAYGNSPAKLENYFSSPIEFGKNVKIDLTVRLNRSYDVLASKTVTI